MNSNDGPILPEGALPRHIAIIMDGNGRWAEQHGKVRHDGHSRGADSVRTVTTAAREIGVEALTLYAFSQQNWGRPGEEVQHLMMLLYEYLEKERNTILENNIRLRGIGETDRLPDFVKDRLHSLEEASKSNTKMTLTLALSYGGREEIVSAAKQVAQAVKDGHLEPEAIDESTIEQFMFTRDLPPLDLLIRTSGEMRLSNFLLWQVAYAEIVVTDCMWPEFGKRQLFECIEQYRGRQRRFGLTGAQTTFGL